MSQRKMSQKNGHSMLRYEARMAYSIRAFYVVCELEARAVTFYSLQTPQKTILYQSQLEKNRSIEPLRAPELQPAKITYTGSAMVGT